MEDVTESTPLVNFYLLPTDSKSYTQSTTPSTRLLSSVTCGVQRLARALTHERRCAPEWPQLHTVSSLPPSTPRGPPHSECASMLAFNSLSAGINRLFMLSHCSLVALFTECQSYIPKVNEILWWQLLTCSP